MDTFIFPPLPQTPRTRINLAAMIREIDRSIADLTEGTRLPSRSYEPPQWSPFGVKQTPRRPAVGDHVIVRVDAYVSKVNDDGTVALTATREPYADAITLDSVEPGAAVLVARDVRAVPKVGQTVSGQTVRETAWKRGTVLRDVTPAEPTFGDRLVLNADGTWINVTAGMSGVPFAAFDDAGRFEIELAPGKPGK